MVTGQQPVALPQRWQLGPGFLGPFPCVGRGMEVWRCHKGPIPDCPHVCVSPPRRAMPR